MSTPSTPRTHVALVRPEYAEAILNGRKRVESRLSRMRCEPFGRVAPGDRVFFKETGGPFRACARIARVARYATLIWLDAVRPVSGGPEYRRIPRRAWFVLDRAA